MKKPKQTNNDFNLLVENAFDFFKKSFVEFDKEPKYSVIHFHAAVELIMKARLLREHWTLIVSRPETANLKSFRSGDFQSVNIREAKTRLESIVQEALSQEEYECFLRLSDHRNRVVHFYHPGNTGDKTALEKIVAEQCLAWYHVSRLFERWGDHFQNYKKEIAKLDKAMHNHRKYLKAKFGALAEDIKTLKDRGITFSICPSCGFKSFGEECTEAPILDYECLVCKARHTGLIIDCPRCGVKNKLIGEPWHKCKKCSKKFDESVVQEFLTKGSVYDKDDLELSNVAHCEQCDGYETVVQVNDNWICSQCFTKYDSEEIGQCGFCGSLSTGNLEDSYLMGCAACDGKSGWDSENND